MTGYLKNIMNRKPAQPAMTPKRRLLLWLIACWFVMPVWAGSRDILVIGDPERSYFRSFQVALQSGLEQSGYAIKVVDIKQTERVRAEVEEHYRCIVTVGHEAAQKSLSWQNSAPLLHALVTQSLAEELQAEKPASTPRAYLLVEQPIARLISLASTLRSKGNRLAVLYGPHSRKYRDEIQRQARLMEFVVVEKVVTDEAELGNAIVNLKGNSDLLLTLPDPVVVNEGTAKTLILGAYMGDLPLIGYSQALVKAGALMSVYSTPEMLGAQSAQLAVSGFWGNTSTATSRIYPSNYQVSVNYQVARALELDLPSEAELASTIKKMEKLR